MNDKFDKQGNPLELMEWVKLLEDNDYRRVALTELDNNVRVSTVWLGLDHSFGQGEPLIFETLVFGGEYDEEMERYSTLEQAKIGHEEMVRKIIETKEK